MFVNKLKQGNKKSFEELFLKTYASLCEYSMSITSSKEAAEGAVQDVFAALWQKKEQLDDDVNIKAYLFRSVKNRSLDIVQYEQIRKKHQTEVVDMYRQYSEEDGDATPSATLIKRVHEEVEKLPEKSKVVYLLHRRDGLTYTEIALVLDISVKAVEARMSKALELLRHRLSRVVDLYLLSILLIFAI